jgi:hypothetical protein
MADETEQTGRVAPNPYSRGDAGRMGLQAFRNASPRQRRFIVLMIGAVLLLPFVGAALSAIL